MGGLEEVFGTDDFAFEESGEGRVIVGEAWTSYTLATFSNSI